MAIIEGLGLRCNVSINGAPAVEYPENDLTRWPETYGAGTSVRHTYIEAVDGAEFSVQASLLDAHTPTKTWVGGKKQDPLFSLSIDGEKDLALDHVNQLSQDCRLDGVFDHMTLKKFRFSPLSLVEESSGSELDVDRVRVNDRLGMIEVRVWRVVKIGKSKDGIIDRGSTPSRRRRAKVNNGESSQRLSPAVDHTYGRVNRWQLIDTEDSPLAVFCFKYRSKEALQGELVLPRSPTQSPVSTTAADSTDDSVDLGALPAGELRRLAQERLAQIKDSKSTARRSKIKRDTELQSKRPLKFVRLENGREAIDLTDD